MLKFGNITLYSEREMMMDTKSFEISRLRHNSILKALREKPTLLIKDLAEQLGVSTSTIRRDLDELEEQGLVRRLFGGVVLNEQPGSRLEPPFETRQIIHAAEKDKVGRAAAELVEDGDILFLDGGTTTQFMVPHISMRKNLVVVTCGLNIASALNHIGTVSTILTGGELHTGSWSLAGPLALQSMDFFEVQVNKAFISCVGVTARHGAMNQMLERIPLKRKAMERAERSYLVVDGSKIGVISLAQIAPIEAFDTLISDCSAPQEALNALADTGIKIKIA